MRWYQLIIVLSLVIVLNVGCEGDNQYIEKYIVTKIEEDNPSLAQLEATYSLAFTDFKEKPIWPFKDNFYIRRDLASVFYGYALKDARIKVIEENSELTLWVQLPDPKRISVDRKIALVEAVPPSYIPIDPATKKQVNIDALMNENLNTAIDMYQEKTIEMTKTMSKDYFEALAYRFGMKLKLEFIGGK